MTVRTASPGFLDVLRLRTFRVLFAAELQSVFGDQLARIALSLLVFARTGSDAATGLTYGLTFLPAILGGVVLARVGDRWQRRTVMITCDLLRCAAFAVMAVPGLPLVGVVAILVVAVFIGPAFNASTVSYLAAKLSREEFRTASGLRMATNQVAQVAGFAVGGVLAGLLGVRQTLLINAATYLVSAIAVWSLRRGRVHADSRTADDVGAEYTGRHAAAPLPPPRLGVMAAVVQQPRARTMLILSSLAGFFIVPEGLAVPFAAQLHAGTTQTGVLLAMIPLGSVVGAVGLTKLVSIDSRRFVTKVMAVAAGLPLMVTLAFPSYDLACVAWFLSGVAAAYQVEALVSLVRSAPDAIRARVASILSSVLLGAQGLGPLVFSALASVTSPVGSVAAAGLAGSVIAAGTGLLDREPD